MVIFQKRVAGMSELALDRFLARARRAACLKGIVNVLVTSSSEMRSLNRRFRGKDKPTDVLSFPAADIGAARRAGSHFRAQPIAGEIAISSDLASRNARLLGHAPAEEIKILTLHGLLHLAGFDHEQDKGQMAERERALRAQFRLPTGLIERSMAPGRGSPKNSVTPKRARKLPQ